MVKRKLPGTLNPQLKPENTPAHKELVRRRRLGQTDLQVKPQSPGSNTSTKAESLGMFDYAHLRVPLPADLKNSGIFTPLKNGQFPESYFLMRRSSDGYISATGMYKAAFPWSAIEEEQTERKHHKALPSGDGDEIAGNVWVAPDDALKLADEYYIRPWILALLDNDDIPVGAKEKIVGEVSKPPRFALSAADKKKILSPAPDLSAPGTKGRSKQSDSPAKSTGTPGRKILPAVSPSKKRTTRGASAKPEDKEETKASEKTPEPKKAGRKVSKKQEAATNGVSDGASPAAKKTADAETVRVEVKETVETQGDKEITKTNVSIELPASHPDLKGAADAAAITEIAQGVIADAKAIQQDVPVTKSRKRKASSSVAKDGTEQSQGPSKVAKSELEQQITSERVKTRALVGLTASLFVGAIIPYFL